MFGQIKSAYYGFANKLLLNFNNAFRLTLLLLPRHPSEFVSQCDFRCIKFYFKYYCMCFQGGIYLFQLVDWYIAIFAVPVFGFIECVIFGWIYGQLPFLASLTNV